jgi:hypothetical protein
MKSGKNTKGTVTRELKGPGTLPLQSALIGGISNRVTSPSSKKAGKTDRFSKGGRAK